MKASCTIKRAVLHISQGSESWLKAARSALKATLTPCPVEIKIDSSVKEDDLELEILCYDPETETSSHFMRRGSFASPVSEIAKELDPVWSCGAWQAVMNAILDAIEYADRATVN